MSIKMVHLLPLTDRYYRIIRTYILGKGGVKRIWSYEGDMNEHRLADPKDLLRGYFLDFSRDADYAGPFDAHAVPLVDYGGLIGRRYNPWAVGHYALASFQRYLQTGDAKYYFQFLKCHDWFLECAEYREDGSIVWSYDFSLVGDCVQRWISSLAQSYAVSVFLRMFLFTKNERCLEIAAKAFLPFTLPVTVGGVQTMDDEGNIFFEEDGLLLIPRILNGFIFALFGIYEFALFSEHAWDLWHKGLDTLRKYLPLYDTGFFSLYNLPSSEDKLRNVASSFYHLVHVRQLQVLYSLTGDSVFGEYAHRWAAFLKNARCRAQAYFCKMIFKLLRY